MAPSCRSLCVPVPQEVRYPLSSRARSQPPATRRETLFTGALWTAIVLSTVSREDHCILPAHGEVRAFVGHSDINLPFALGVPVYSHVLQVSSCFRRDMQNFKSTHRQFHCANLRHLIGHYPLCATGDLCVKSSTARPLPQPNGNDDKGLFGYVSGLSSTLSQRFVRYSIP